MQQPFYEYGAELLTLMKEVQNRHPDSPVVIGDLLELMRPRHPEATARALRSAVCTLKREGLVEHQGPGLYRFPPLNPESRRTAFLTYGDAACQPVPNFLEPPLHGFPVYWVAHSMRRSPYPQHVPEPAG
ncbi:hypothetical protein SAMN00790413_04391 [Deinococcus hopiensis KR-140]|uniref:Uncharacterized protein n=1 Tax=Deinococcus hopiensis KR-140 TaxID=695939 RepID=A0A1W1UQM4_9DEIO|nr:hypothetical protein SAMN00790413_04391 [Deinococcus hopiensis KR-140]